MNLLKRTIVALLLALAAGSRAFAASSATVHIEVTIAANLSVEIDGGSSSTHSFTWNAAQTNLGVAATSTVTVRSDTGGLTTRWALSSEATTANLNAGADVWTLASSTSSVGADQIGVQAVFGSQGTPANGCPAGNASDWDQSYAPPLTATPAEYKTTRFSDPNLSVGGTPDPDQTGGAANGLMHAGSRRALCWRLVMPSATSTVDPQNVQIIVTAVMP